MQTFKHKDGIVLQELKTKNIDGKRHYVTPGGNYPSVTSITSQLSAEGIKAWRSYFKFVAIKVSLINILVQYMLLKLLCIATNLK